MQSKQIFVAVQGDLAFVNSFTDIALKLLRFDLEASQAITAFREAHKWSGYRYEGQFTLKLHEGM